MTPVQSSSLLTAYIKSGKSLALAISDMLTSTNCGIKDNWISDTTSSEGIVSPPLLNLQVTVAERRTTEASREKKELRVPLAPRLNICPLLTAYKGSAEAVVACA